MRIFLFGLILFLGIRTSNAVEPPDASIAMQCPSAGVSPESPPMEEQQEEEGGLDSLKSELERLKEFLEALPKSDAAKRIRESLEKLGSEIERLEKSFRDSIEKEILPRIWKEIERLKKELYRYLEEPEDENKPTKVEVPALCPCA
jgi:hypothetical protein